jgi:pseudaminic acid cytidylyltransferase
VKVAVIPARSGSKRIPNKNVRMFCGKPMLVWALEETIASEVFDKVIVSTDCQQIAELACRYGAETPFLRDAKNSDDFATIADVLQHSLISMNSSDKIEWLCCVYATAPMISRQDLSTSFEQMIKASANQCLSVCEFPYPPQRALRIDADGLLKMQYPEYQNTRSQDLEALYQDAAHFFWLSSQSLKGEVSTNRIAYQVNRERVVDIDTEEDWVIAERAMQSHLLSKKAVRH